MKPKDRYYESSSRGALHSASCSSDDESPMDLSVKKVSSSLSHSHHLSPGAYESLRCAASRSINSHHLSHSHLLPSSHHQHQVHSSSALNQNLLMNELAARYMILNSELRSSSQSPVHHSHSHSGGGGGGGSGAGGGAPGSLSSLLPYLLLRPFGSSDASSLLSASSPSHSPSGNLHHQRQGDNLLLAAAAAAAAAASSPTNSPRPLRGSSSGPGHLLASVVRHSQHHHLHHQRNSPALSPGIHSSDIDLPLTVDSVTATADLLLDSTGGSLTNKPRITRPLTGRYVRHGTGASPSTLLSLRKMLEERKMRIKPLPRKGYKKNVRRRK